MTGDRQSQHSPRELSKREREVLDFLLAVDFPGVEALRVQAEHVRAMQELERCPTINLWVDHQEAPRAEIKDGVPIETMNLVPWDSDDFVQVLLFVADGWLSSIELVHYETIPEEFPAPSELRPPELVPAGGYVGRKV